MVISGKELSAQLKDEMKAQVAAFPEKYGRVPHLVVILVGEDPGSVSYVTGKAKASEYVGIRNTTIRKPETISEAELLGLIDELNADDSVDGILVQLPLPKHISEDKVIATIAREKDVDGFHIQNAGKLLNGLNGVIACTPKGALEMIRRTGVDLSGKEAVVVGRSNIVGKPMAMLLLQQNCTVTVCHSRTADLAAHTRRADVLVAAVGKAKFITADMVKPGAIVIDVGINRLENGKVVGDVDFDAVKEVASWITPVPGGVGRMTITMLLENTVEAAEKLLR